MREETARRLSQLTSAFYDEVAGSFAQTRQAPWPGWGRVMDACLSSAGARAPVVVLDLACGNLRFERFLESWSRTPREPPSLARGSRAPGVLAFDVCAVDGCAALSQDVQLDAVGVRQVSLDISQALFEGHDLAAILGPSAYDLAVCFGFLHHVPTCELRTRLLRHLVACAAPGAVVAVSLWQLSRSAQLLERARTSTDELAGALGLRDLDQGDYLLGWQGRRDVCRYCHDFDEREVDGLAAAVGAQAREVARYSADGRTGDLNRYLVLQRI